MVRSFIWSVAAFALASGCQCGPGELPLPGGGSSPGAAGAGSDGGAAGGSDAGDLFDAGSGQPRGACLSNGWCWLYPLPQGNALFDVHGTSANDVWAGGALGALVRFDGTSWSAVDTPSTSSINAVWARAADDAYFARDDGEVMRWNGTSLSLLPSTDATPLRGIGPLPDGRLLFVGDQGTARIWDGSAWLTLPTGTTANLRSVGGPGPSIVGDGTIKQWNGAQLVDGPAPDGYTLRGVASLWGNLLVVGDDVVHSWSSSSTWRHHSVPFQVPTWYDAWTATPTETWVVGRSGGDAAAVKLGGAASTNLTLVGNVDNRLYGVWGSSPDDFWAVGRYGLRLRGDSGHLGRVVPEQHEPIFSATLARDGTVLGAWQGRVYYYPPSAGRVFSHASVTSKGAFGADGLTKDDVWVSCTGGRVVHYRPPEVDFWDLPNSPELFDVYVASNTDVWVVGNKDALWHFDGAQWSPESPTIGGQLNAVDGTSASDVWAVGKLGTLLHRDATGWSAVPLGVQLTLTGVHAAATDAVTVVGTGGYTAHFDGKAWARLPAGAWVSATGVWAPSGSDVWVADRTGAVHHFDGTQWSVDRVTTHTLYGVTGDSHNVYVVGEGGSSLVKKR